MSAFRLCNDIFEIRNIFLLNFETALIFLMVALTPYLIFLAQNIFGWEKKDNIPYISEYESRVQFSFKNLSKIENSYVSRVGKNRKLVKYEKNKISPSRKKKKFSIQTYCQRAKMFPSVSSSDDITVSVKQTSTAATPPPPMATS